MKKAIQLLPICFLYYLLMFTTSLLLGILCTSKNKLLRCFFTASGDDGFV